MFSGFEPFFDEESQILIVGSFPSVKSRENGFYYGNKQNRFWKMLSKCFGEGVFETIEQKKDFLKRHKIALYDVVVESDLNGSADSTLLKSNKSLAKMDFLLPPHTNVKKIVCNGKTSFKLLNEAGELPVEIVCLPSTSSANPRFSYEVWERELKKVLE